MEYILAIESSCDDTSAAVVCGGKVLSNIVATQKIHEQYGGVVPEVASRQHHIDIVPVVTAALEKAGVQKNELAAIAFTRGPGLLGSLLVGVTFAKGLALALNLPLIEVHHMHAHILAHFAEDTAPDFPFLCLTISGGHTQIVKVSGYNKMEVMGETIDDAAGEAFDKTGKMMGLAYPAGPEIDQRAKLGMARYAFNEPSLPGYDYSFSGLKTSILYFLQKKQKEDPKFIAQNLDDLCASIQATIVKIVFRKLNKAVKDTGINRVAIAGGVAANSGIRAALKDQQNNENWEIYIPAFQYCTDNAGMVGIAAYFKYKDRIFSEHSVTPDPRLKF